MALQVGAHKLDSGAMTPAEDITSNIFFNDSGIASNKSSLLSAFMKVWRRSRTVNQSGRNPGRLKRGVRWWRKTLERRVAALNLVSSTPIGSFGAIGSWSWANNGNRTCSRHCDHSMAVSWVNSWARRDWRKVIAEARTGLLQSPQSLAIPWNKYESNLKKIEFTMYRARTYFTDKKLVLIMAGILKNSIKIVARKFLNNWVICI